MVCLLTIDFRLSHEWRRHVSSFKPNTLPSSSTSSSSSSSSTNSVETETEMKPRPAPSKLIRWQLSGDNQSIKTAGIRWDRLQQFIRLGRSARGDSEESTNSQGQLKIIGIATLPSTSKSTGWDLMVNSSPDRSAAFKQLIGPDGFHDGQSDQSPGGTGNFATEARQGRAATSQIFIFSGPGPWASISRCQVSTESILRSVLI